MKQRLLPLLCFIVIVSSCSKSTNSAPGTLPNSYSNQAPGALARDMLTSNTYTTLDVQIQYMPGYELDPATISNVTAYLSAVCNKPGGVNITQAQIAGSGSDTLNVAQVAVTEAQNRTLYTNGSALCVYVLVTDGYDTSMTTLGFAYRNTSICLFGKDMFNSSGGVGEPSRIGLESTVLEHEFGHIMGLVNLGTPMVVFHQDTAHGNHCNNPDCLMYYAVEIHTGLASLASHIPSLDSNCLNDLHANGGK